MNIGKSRVMRCSRYSNGDRMHVILNGELLEKVNCLSKWGRNWQLMEDVKGMWYTMNEGYRTWGALNSVLSSRGLLNRGLGIKAKKCLYEGVIFSSCCRCAH